MQKVNLSQWSFTANRDRTKRRLDILSYEVFQKIAGNQTEQKSSLIISRSSKNSWNQSCSHTLIWSPMRCTCRHLRVLVYHRIFVFVCRCFYIEPYKSPFQTQQMCDANIWWMRSYRLTNVYELQWMPTNLNALPFIDSVKHDAGRRFRPTFTTHTFVTSFQTMCHKLKPLAINHMSYTHTIPDIIYDWPPISIHWHPFELAHIHQAVRTHSSNFDRTHWMNECYLVTHSNVL